MNDHSHSSRFECPICTFMSGFDGTCPRCDVLLQDTTQAQPWQLESRLTRPAEFSSPALAYLSVGLLLLSVVMAAFATRRFGEGGFWGVFLLGSLSAFLPLFWESMWATRRRWLAVHRKTPTVERSTSVRDGARVALVGRPTVRTFALAAPGTDAIAIDVRSTSKRQQEGRSMPFDDVPPALVSSSGGEIELRTSDGVLVRVRLNCFVMANGEPLGRNTIIPAGAEVRVSGVARWRTEMDAAGLRSAGRVIELEGSEKEPIVIEMTAPAQQNLDELDREMSEEIHTPTNVRVAVASDANVRDEGESIEASARQAHTPSGVQKR